MKKIIFAYSLFSTVVLQAQDKTAPTFLERTEFKIGYVGNIAWNNGLDFGTEYLLKENIKIKEKKRSQKTIKHHILLAGNLALTNNFSSETDAGAFTTFGLAWRRTNTKGRQFSIELNPLGYYRSFLPETFEVVGDDVKRIFLPGRNYYAPSLSVGIGRQREGKTLSGWYLNLNFMYRMPYNTGLLPALYFQYGYRFNAKKRR